MPTFEVTFVHIIDWLIRIGLPYGEVVRIAYKTSLHNHWCIEIPVQVQNPLAHIWFRLLLESEAGRVVVHNATFGESYVTEGGTHKFYIEFIQPIDTAPTESREFYDLVADLMRREPVYPKHVESTGWMHWNSKLNPPMPRIESAGD